MFYRSVSLLDHWAEAYSNFRQDVKLFSTQKPVTNEKMKLRIKQYGNVRLFHTQLKEAQEFLLPSLADLNVK
jgi:hypothetical protein